MNIKPIIIALVVLVAFIQYEIWLAPGGLRTLWNLKHNIVKQHAKNAELLQRNKTIAADIKDLRRGRQAVEERARSELGMVKDGETYYQVVKRSDDR